MNCYNLCRYNLKKTAAILLLGLFLFNWFGYRLLTSLLVEHANTSLEADLDNNNYVDSDLISIKIPANLPYHNNSKEYTRVDGEINLAGIHYKYVKYRLYNDSLEYLCIPNQATTKLTNARDAFFGLVNDIQQSTSEKKAGKNSGPIKNLLSEYDQNSPVLDTREGDPENCKHFSFYLLAIVTAKLSPEEQPPDTPVL